MKKAIVILVLIISGFANELIAHPGGHYSQTDFFNSWQLIKGEIIKGNFSRAKDGLLFLEQANGKFMVIPINQLSAQDQKLANFKIQKLEDLNVNYVPKKWRKSESISPHYSFYLIMLPIVGLVFLAISLFKKIYPRYYSEIYLLFF